MRKSFGSVLRQVRESKDLSREDLAKKVHISAVYVSHLENENPAASVSDRLFERLQKTLHIRNHGLRDLAERHNARVSRYTRERRKKAA